MINDVINDVINIVINIVINNENNYLLIIIGQKTEVQPANGDVVLTVSSEGSVHVQVLLLIIINKIILMTFFNFNY